MWFLFVLVLGGTAAVLSWRAAVRSWDVTTPRQALETAWYRMSPPRSMSVGALQQRVLRATVNARVVSVRGVCLVPSTFEVALHPDDLAAIEGVRDWIGSELATALTERAEQEGWQLRGRPVIGFVADPSRVPGHPDVVARHETITMAVVPSGTGEANRGPARPPAPSVGWLRPLGDHDPIALTVPEPIVLGRGATATVDLREAAVSRRHCELRPSPDGWTVIDLGSANGTTLNDRPVSGGALLHPGDVLNLGNAAHFVAEAIDAPTSVGPASDGLELPPMPRTEIVSISGRR